MSEDIDYELEAAWQDGFEAGMQNVLDEIDEARAEAYERGYADGAAFEREFHIE